MGHLRSMAGYLWALLALPVILSTFLGQGFWANQLVAVTGIHVSPWLAGGEVVQTIDHRQYRIILHRPVFDGLVGQRNQGFVQINWQPVAEFLPAIIKETVDYDRDGMADFKIEFDTKTNHIELSDKKPYVLGIEQVYKLENERAVRVLLKYQNK